MLDPVVGVAMGRLREVADDAQRLAELEGSLDYQLGRYMRAECSKWPRLTESDVSAAGS